MRSFMPSLVANESLRRRICSDVLCGTLSHAYIIEGVRGSGKHTVARLTAAALACENKGDDGKPLPCGECPTCKKILSGLCPDIITVGREDRATMGVDSVRFLKGDVSVVPNDLDYKIYVIEDADKMTSHAQNAFLLTLEEPPSYVLFLLLCENSGALLETIRSRAPIIRTEPIAKDLIDEYISSNDPRAHQMKSSAPADYAELLMAADGGIGKALELLEPKTFAPILSRRRLVKEFISCAVNRSSAKDVLSLLSRFSSKREDIAEELSMIRAAIRDLLALKKSETPPLLFYENVESATEISERVSATRLVELSEMIWEAEQRTAMNANVRLTLISLFSEARMI